MFTGFVQKLQQKINSVAERALVCALERCLARQAWVLASEFKRQTERAESFEKSVKEIEEIHRRCIVRLDARLSKLEAGK
jgi:hypothetical protein